MATPRPENPHRPELVATEARQSRPSRGAFLMLAVSTIVGLIAVALIWAVFAGPLHHTTNSPQVSSPQEAGTVHVTPQPGKTIAPADGESPANGGTGQPQGSASSR